MINRFIIEICSTAIYGVNMKFQPIFNKRRPKLTATRRVHTTGAVSRSFLTAIVLLAAAAAWAQKSTPAERTIQVDGKLDDWQGIPALATDKKEDARPCDWRALYLAHDATNLYIRYTCEESIDFDRGAAYNIFLDTDRKRSTGFRGAGDEFPIGADHLVQGATLYSYKGDGTSWSWDAKGTLPFAISKNEVELSVSRELIGKPDAGFELFLYGDNEAAGIGGKMLDLCPDDAFKQSREGKLRYSWQPTKALDASP